MKKSILFIGLLMLPFVLLCQSKTIDLDWEPYNKNQSQQIKKGEYSKKSIRKTATPLIDLVVKQDMMFFEQWEDKGYIDDNEVDVYFGQRDITNLENSLQASYNFDPYKAIDLRFRNFWSTADYSKNIFFELNEDGSLSPIDYDISENDPNANFNIWNLDLSFRWRFAPGSEATLLYRNQIFNFDEQSTLGYGDSLNNLFDQPQQNTVSLKVTYFIDYNNVKYLFNKNS